MSDIQKLRERLNKAKHAVTVLEAKIQLAQVLGPKKSPFGPAKRPKKRAAKKAAKKARKR